MCNSFEMISYHSKLMPQYLEPPLVVIGSTKNPL
jgi:hypothetical protein